jgi:GWxTD domain-containing protein
MKGSNYIITGLYSLLLLFVLNGCSSSSSSGGGNNYLYDDRIKEINPSYFIYHKNDTLSELYFQVKSNELLYVRENVSQPFEATVKFVYSIYNTRKQKVLVDSATNLLIDTKTSSNIKNITGKIPLRLKQGTLSAIKIEAIDINKRAKSVDVIEINKVTTDTRQYFLLTKQNKEICFDNYFTQDEYLTIQSDFNQLAKIKVNYTQAHFEMAKPPFASNNETPEFVNSPDSVMSLSLINGKTNFALFNQGIYSFVLNNKRILTLNYLDENFPEIINHAGMVKPLRYICTNKEYEVLLSATDKKKAVEDFWLKMSGSKDRARILIREYYNRLLLANKHFSSYKEGWKTDRGMLSIVMGAPNTINAGNNGETWLYGTSHNMMMSLSFSFYKPSNSFFTNDYRLDRYRLYKDYWYRAVESWRQGRPYTFN